VVPIDTCLEDNAGGLRTPAEVETLIARMDVVVTTRLHGTVLSLKNGVPALAVDPIAGGAKILRQAEVLGWPVVLTADRFTPQALAEAYDFCLTKEARDRAAHCAARAREAVARTGAELVAWVAASAAVAEGS
jgi:polysaccharide pyruvyl transferase WcaK-like protein